MEFAPWSRAELRGGVRLTPIADVVIPVMSANKDFVALRCPIAGTDASSKLDPTGPQIIKRLGSQYSIADLKARAVAAYGKEYCGSCRLKSPLITGADS